MNEEPTPFVRQLENLLGQEIAAEALGRLSEEDKEELAKALAQMARIESTPRRPEPPPGFMRSNRHQRRAMASQLRKSRNR